MPTNEENPAQLDGPNILVVDDGEEDVLFLRRAFAGLGLRHRLTHVADGEEAIKYLSRQAPYDDNALYPVPDVVVLDLKMPKRDGFEVLQWLREQKTLKPAPVAVLTSSNRDEDKKRAKDLGAGSYYTKPVDFTKLVGVAKDINRRWLSHSRALGLLIVDDDENDRFLLQRAFEKLNVGYRIQPLRNGGEALAVIKGEGIYANRKAYPFPSFILTDLKMPGGDGFEILSYLKEHPEILIVPVVMLSGSDDPDDVRQAYLLGASSFIVKPQGLDGLEGIVQKLHYYWSECEVPLVDESGHAIMPSSVGKMGDRFNK
ncbi:MAG TPA: response regulator [Verrucomicrobiae bacterium]|jgi:CheY-like chemotaxis protein|nr:response regulator [Verrucomicrobiae bacterium]